MPTDDERRATETAAASLRLDARRHAAAYEAALRVLPACVERYGPTRYEITALKPPSVHLAAAVAFQVGREWARLWYPPEDNS